MIQSYGESVMRRIVLAVLRARGGFQTRTISSYKNKQEVHES